MLRVDEAIGVCTVYITVYIETTRPTTMQAMQPVALRRGSSSSSTSSLEDGDDVTMTSAWRRFVHDPSSSESEDELEGRRDDTLDDVDGGHSLKEPKRFAVF